MEKNGDFEFANALSMAVNINLYTQNQMTALNSQNEFTRAFAVICMANSLMTPVKGSDNIKLIDRLVEFGTITPQAADLFLNSLRIILEK